MKKLSLLGAALLSSSLLLTACSKEEPKKEDTSNSSQEKKEEKTTTQAYNFTAMDKDGKEVKMSKRLGTSLTLRELLDLVGKDALRFFLIERSYNSKIDFDIEKVNKKDETNPMFIIKYAHARCYQLLEKSSFKNPRATNFENEYAQKLINELIEYPELIKTMAKTYKVNLLPPYLLKLAVHLIHSIQILKK